MNIIIIVSNNLTELVKRSKFYRSVIEEISDNIEKNPVLEEAKDFTQGMVDDRLRDEFYEAEWEKLKPELTDDVDLPLIVSRDPVSSTLAKASTLI